MSWYDLNYKEEEEKEQEVNAREYLAKIKYDKIICKKASNFKDIVGVNLEQNTQYRIVTDKSFNAITVVSYLLEYYNIDEIYMVVYRMNNKSFDYLKSIIEKDNIKTGLIVSSFFRENKRYERWAKEIKILSENTENVKTSFCNSHAKVFLAKTTCGKHIVFEGSGNLSDNARIEQYIFEDNESVYNFHKKWIDDILNLEK